MMGNYGYGSGVGWFGGLMMLLFMAALIVLIVWAVRALFPTPRRDERGTTLAVLQRRFASGEISEAEYERARRILAGTEVATPQHGTN